MFGELKKLGKLKSAVKSGISLPDLLAMAAEDFGATVNVQAIDDTAVEELARTFPGEVVQAKKHGFEIQQIEATLESGRRMLFLCLIEPDPAKTTICGSRGNAGRSE